MYGRVPPGHRKINASLPFKEADQLRELARKESGRTMSSVLRALAREWIAEQERRECEPRGAP